MCEPERSRGPSLRGVLAAAGGLVAAGWVVRALSAAGGLAAAVAATEGVLAAVGTGLLVRNLRAGRPRHAERMTARAALAAARRALEPPSHAFIEVNWMKDCGYLDHPQANRCYLPRQAHQVVHVITDAARERISR